MAKLVCAPSPLPVWWVKGPAQLSAPLTVVYLVSILWKSPNGTGWHSSILPRRKGIQRAVALSLYTKKCGTWSLRSPSLLVWPD